MNTLKTVIVENIMAVEYIEQMTKKSGGRPSEVLVTADKACVRGRRLFERMITVENTGKRPQTAQKDVLQ